MDIKTYRARSMNEALALVRDELGPDAAVLHTREAPSGWLRRLAGRRTIEVTASAAVHVPSRLPQRLQAAQASASQAADPAPPPKETVGRSTAVEPLHQDYRAKYRDDLKEQIDHLQSMVEHLCQQTKRTPRHELPEAMFHIFTDLIDAEIGEELAREWIDQVSRGVTPEELTDPFLIKTRLAHLIEQEIAVSGPVTLEKGRRKLVALVGPTGVGKTTTIAKLAANFRLREKRRVGLITVDTYRIAAVEQLRTYAEIIDLPMEVVSTPREMREAVDRLAGLDLVLMDTAGRSPRDEIRVGELKAMLAEAQPDEVHLVLSACSGAKNLAATIRNFQNAGATRLILTKLDEASSLGNLAPLVRDCRLPLSYLTAGQNVPDDIQVAHQKWLAREILAMEQ